MQVPIEQISFEQLTTELGRVFADCFREEFENILPDATITIYVKQLKTYERGVSSGILFHVSDDSVTEEKLGHLLRSHSESLTQKILDKASSTYRGSRRYPDVNQRIGFLGKILELGEMEITRSESMERSNLDNPDFYEIAMITLEKHWLYKIEIDKDLAIKVIKFTAPYLSKLLSELGPEFIEFIKENL